MKLPIRFPAFALLVTAIWTLSFYGIESIPLEKHEVFVLETSQTMLETGDWIVPRFNGELRLQKPPLDYWATCAVVLLDPFNDSVRIGHGRLVSLLAGLGILLIAAAVGRRLYGETAGMLTATVLLCMQGFLHLSYNARPDPLYGFFSLLQLFCWIGAWRGRDGGWKQRNYAWGGWASAALALLTKGPQVPVMFLLGLLIFLIWNGERKRILPILRPVTGLALAALITLPWPLLLNHRLRQEGVDLGDSQLSGSLLTQFASWRDLMSFYYPVRLLPLLLPTLFLLPLLLYRMIRHREALLPVTRLLLITLFILLFVYSLGGQYRKHYLYPALPLIALLTAEGVLHLPCRRLKKHQKRFLLAAAGVGLLAYAVLLVHGNPAHALLMLPLSALGIWVLVRRIHAHPAWPEEHVGRQLTAFGLVLALAISGIYSTLPHRADRQANQELARRLSERLASGSPVVSFSPDDFTLPYYLHHRVEERGLPEAPQDPATLFPRHRSVVAVVPEASLQKFEPATRYEILDRSVIPGDPEENQVVIRIPAG